MKNDERMKKYERRRNLLLVLEVLGAGLVAIGIYYIICLVILMFG